MRRYAAEKDHPVVVPAEVVGVTVDDQCRAVEREAVGDDRLRVGGPDTGRQAVQRHLLRGVVDIGGML